VDLGHTEDKSFNMKDKMKCAILLYIGGVMEMAKSQEFQLLLDSDQ
jgi:hypothetical protein